MLKVFWKHHKVHLLWGLDHYAQLHYVERGGGEEGVLQVNRGEVMTLLNSFVGRIIIVKYAVLTMLTQKWFNKIFQAPATIETT